MKRIHTKPSHNSKVVLVSDEDYHFLQQYSWYVKNGYAYTTLHKKGCARDDPNRNVNLSMSRVVAERYGILSEEKPTVDHRNGDRLDNQRHNLRPVTVQENNWNLLKHRDGTLKGVYLTADNTYQVRLGKTIYGNYKDRYTAELVYDRVAKHVREDFAVLHHPNNLDELPADFPIVNFNKKPGAAHKSGVPGVVWFKARKCWRVIVNKKTLGYFDNVDEAIAFRRTK